MRIQIGEIILEQRPDLWAGLCSIGEVQAIDTYTFPMSLIAQIGDFEPDLILVGAAMLDVSFVLDETLRRAGRPNTPIVLLVDRPSSVDMVRSAHAGFAEVIDLSVSLPEMLRALQRADEGKYSFDRDPLWKRIARPLPSTDLSQVAGDLMDQEILSLIAVGLSDAFIAETLGVSAQTARNRVSQMLGRAGLSNRTQLAWAVTHQRLLSRLIVAMGYMARPKSESST